MSSGLRCHPSLYELAFLSMGAVRLHWNPIFGGAVHELEVGSLALHLTRVSACPISRLSPGDLIEGQLEGDGVMKWV